MGGVDDYGEFPYSQSLCSTYVEKHLKEKTCPSVLPILCLAGDEDYDQSLFEKAKEHAGAVIFIRGLDSSEYYYDGDFKRAYENSTSSPEQEFVYKHWAHSGGLKGTRIEEPVIVNTYRQQSREYCGMTPY